MNLVPHNNAIAAEIAKLDRAKSDLMDSLLNRACENGEIARELSESERDFFTSRLKELEKWLAPSALPDLEGVVAVVLAPFALGRVSEKEAEETIKLYCASLKGSPLWALVKACSQVLQGTTGASPDYRPTPARLAVTVSTILEPLRTEHAKIERLLNAPVAHSITAQERARVMAQFKELSALLAKHGGSSKEIARNGLKTKNWRLENRAPQNKLSRD